MSKYHSKCTENNEPEECKRRAAGRAPLTSKPFCDCKICTCKTCPDILKLLCISVTENSCDFGSKGKEAKVSRSGHDLEPHQSLLNMLKQEDCACEVVARAVRSGVHMNIGMSERRAATNEDTKSTTSKDIEPDK